MDPPFLVSSPGKVILFGEHAVVYNQPAVAASVSVRQYLLVSKNSDSDSIELDFPDIGFKETWSINSLPWDIVHEELHAIVSNNREHEHELRMDLVEKLHNLINVSRSEGTGAAHAAALAFLYLYLHICTPQTPGNSYSVHSLIPVGAGLGSSAAFSVCISTGLLLVQGFIKVPHSDDSNDVIRYLDLISGWSYIGEMCIHGRPSGIDNAVATRGGAVLFQKNPRKLQPFSHFPRLKLVLTDTRVPRSTADLVSNVRSLKMKSPQIIDPILQSIGQISLQAVNLINNNAERYNAGIPDDGTISHELSSLIHMNHALLSSLGVSHASLEKVKMAADSLQLGETKLTGAGGGGCAITLVDYEGYHKDIGDHERKVDELRQMLPNDYQVFESVLGGPGVAFSKPTKQLDRSKFVQLSNIDDLESLGDWKFWTE